MRSVLLIVLAAGMSIFLAACGGAETQTPAGTAAPAKITVNTNPNPPMAGDVELLFTIVDDQGQPVSGADFDVIADHTDMSGMTMHGKATDQGNGNYAIMTNFSMTGNWMLTVQVRKDALDFKQDIDLEIK
jgi:YtkA-like